MAKIKICGITRECDLAAINLAKPDYFGFVFAKSKRQISFDKAKMLKQMLKKEIRSVGVFVNEKIQNIVLACDLGIIDIIQLHGDEDNDYISKLRQLTDKQIIKAVRVRDEQDIARAEEIACDFILFDAFKKDCYGGGGAAFDWQLLCDFKKPYFLAGGLDGQNIEAAISALNPFAVDVSSGVETDGYKDKEKIQDFIEKVRRMQDE